MPTYEYECSECNWRFEKKQRFQDEPVAECPKCQSKSRRIMVPSQIIFKGSGFYVNDYPKTSNHETSEKPKPEAGSDGNLVKSGAVQAAVDSSKGAAAGQTTGSSSSQQKQGTDNKTGT
ncbi:MAG: hypothetical protein JXA46_02735 [Dehalococcoidales bacterium]|nr:hypothetical protein [Dehalococcoidales bacterium]